MARAFSTSPRAFLTMPCAVLRTMPSVGMKSVGALKNSRSAAGRRSAAASATRQGNEAAAEAAIPVFRNALRSMVYSDRLGFEDCGELLESEDGRRARARLRRT